MSEPQTTVSDYAQELIDTPRAHLSLELNQDENGLKVLYRDKVLLACPLTRAGMTAAVYISQSLGVKIPPLGESIVVRASTGVFYRAVSIAGLDFENEESFVLLERLLEEAEMQRGGLSDSP